MKLSGKLTFELIAVKPIRIEKDSNSTNSIILPSGVKAKDEEDSLADYPDHIAQGLVIAVADSVTICKPGDIVLFTISSDYMAKPTYLNDKGSLYHIYRQTDIVLVREGNVTT